MRISIWDLDWYYKFSFIPNHKAQKISSYHKQKNDFINFIEDESYINFDYDIMYILKEKDVTPMPPTKYIDNSKVKLVGRVFDYYDNYYILPAIIEMVRPDYSLYKVEERNSYANAHMLQLLHGTQLLPAKQDPINYHTKFHKKTVIVDELIWKTDDKTLEKCFDEIEQYKNIAFLHPISLKRITQSNFKERFANLKFSSGTYFKFKNDYGSEYEQVVDIIDLMIQIKDKNPSVSLQGFPVKAVLYDHWKDKNLGIKDLERILKILDYSKKHKVKVIVKTPKERLVTPYWVFFDMMETWTKDYYGISYIESMLSTRIIKTKEQWHEVINDSKKWSTPRIYFLLHLINNYPSLILNYGVRKWGDEKLDVNWIDLREVVKFNYYFEQEDILKKIQEEILQEVDEWDYYS